MKATSSIIPALVLVLLVSVAVPASALEVKSDHPYAGAVAVDASTGRVLFESDGDAAVYPASLVKLMVMLIILEAVDSERLTLDEVVKVTAESARMGGSQVYLKEHEVFTVDELLYALIVKSANDAAVALAIHVAGSKTAFVELMNARAAEIGMSKTVFHSVHGLPPGRGQKPDVSTARDIAKLSRVLLRRGDVLKYTSTRRRLFRTDAEEPFVMVNHNPLLKSVDGCDGLKTGFFYAAGFSISATAMKDDKRVIAVVVGAQSQRVRDARAKKMLTDGLKLLAQASPPFSSEPAGSRKAP